ncbi:MAG: alanine--tRNA ligase, partial [Leptospiraceae bacterium]|nr:alanine--tRNA ligase [Leptospiraceae bacterium]
MSGQETEFTLAKIRRKWIDFFHRHDHEQAQSASLIPAGDPTLLFTTAGMVQFKSYFAGTSRPPHPRLSSIQKCLRTTDLEEVGQTDRHCTFFEMLGNFSFGDYFKFEAIDLAWEFSLQELGLDPDRIYVTVYLDDDEAADYWHNTIGLPRTHITKLGKADNWWGPAGETGACGPCSELYLDRGEQVCTCADKQACQPGNDCERFMEYWNLVFNQFHQDAQGQLTPLPQTGIDTGAGLERLAALLNNKSSVYDTDEMARIIVRIEELSSELRSDGKKLQYDPAHNPAPFRVITDHVRAATFSIADGIYPDNTGRGYVIRRIIRRALLFARELGIHTTILHRLVPKVIEIYKPFYANLAERQAEIEECIRLEEERFLRTLDHGMQYWESFLADHQKRAANQFDGQAAFVLYDTYGFPLEMTKELALKNGLVLDQSGYDQAMQAQQERSRSNAAWQDWQLPADLGLPKDFATSFSGYQAMESKGSIQGLVSMDGRRVDELQSGESGLVILDESVFYPEGGGQLGDQGTLQNDTALFAVSDCRKINGITVHIGELKSGVLKPTDTVTAVVDQDRRQALTRHHSATHLLNAALRTHLGEHVGQTGSLVAPESLRFDFSHPERMTEEQIGQVEASVLQAIQAAEPVQASVMPKADAQKLGAVAAFGEKYGDEVRVVQMGPQGGLSLEFCGGCHVANTGDIQYFHIVREASPGAGNRRIEALAGNAVLAWSRAEIAQILAEIEDFHQQAKGVTGSNTADYEKLTVPTSLGAATTRQIEQDPTAVQSVARELLLTRQRLDEARKELVRYQKKQSQAAASSLLEGVDEILDQAELVGDTRVITIQVESASADALRQLADKLREKSRNVVFLGACSAPKVLLLFAADKAAIQSGVHCGNLIKAVAPLVGGGGGGRPDMAQAGG